jgi:predicted nucleic acid-binding protein
MNSADPRNNSAREEFRQVRNGSFSLLVSNWVRLEIVKVLIDSAMRDPTVRAARSGSAVEGFVRTNLANFERSLLRMPNTHLADPSVSVRNLLKRALDLSQRIFGDSILRNDCPICHSAMSYLQYKGPLQIDIIHALIARDLRCDKMLTYDHGFSLLGAEQLIQPLTIEVL